MIEYLKGNVIESDCDVIIHGCNCFRNMSSGIAKAIKEIYPEAFVADFGTVYRDRNKLGTFSHVKVKNKFFPEKDVYIVNAYTQYTFGRKEGEIYADYEAIRNVMLKVNSFFVNTHDTQFKIGMPKIGAGLARGDWEIISSLINEAFGSRKVYVYIFDVGEVKKEEFDLENLKQTWRQQLGLNEIKRK